MHAPTDLSSTRTSSALSGSHSSLVVIIAHHLPLADELLTLALNVLQPRLCLRGGRAVALRRRRHARPRGRHWRTAARDDQARLCLVELRAARAREPPPPSIAASAVAGRLPAPLPSDRRSDARFNARSADGRARLLLSPGPPVGASATSSPSSSSRSSSSPPSSPPPSPHANIGRGGVSLDAAGKPL